jgi:replicative DNA helicase
MEPLLAHDLQPHHFLQRKDHDQSPEPTPGEVYTWMLQSLRRFRSVPSLDLLKSRFPLFEISESSDGVAALMEEMIGQISRRLAGHAAREIAAIADDPSRWLSAEAHVFEVARDLSRAMPGSSVTRFSDAINFLDLYKEKALTGKTPGISFSMQWLDDLTYGIQSHEMMIIEAFLGQKKSSLSLKICADAYFMRDKTPLFFSFEMEGQKLVERWIAYAAGIKYGALKRLELGEGDLKRWEEIGERAEAAKFEKDILVIDDERRPTDDFVYSRIERWQPDFSVIDTLDEVRAPSTIRGGHWEKQDHVAREVKGIARATRRPIIAIAQANRDAAKDGATLDNIAGSVTIARKADIAIGLHATDDQKKAHMCEVTLLKNRDDMGEGTKRAMYFNVGTGELRPWLPGDNIASKTS